MSSGYSLIVPAAGSGIRAGGDLPKQWVPLLDRPVIAHTLLAFATHPDCREIIVAVSPAWMDIARESLADIRGVRFAEGGSERQYSIANALAITDPQNDLVLVHDAARPCVQHDLISRIVTAAAEYGAAVPALQLADTIKQVDETGRVLSTIPRETLRTIQTPQGFRRELLLEAFRYAEQHGVLGTDDASLVEALGEPVVTVEGQRSNIKITVAEDFAKAEGYLQRG